MHEQTLSRLAAQQLLLLRWLLTEASRPASEIVRVSIEDVRRILPGLKGMDYVR